MPKFEGPPLAELDAAGATHGVSSNPDVVLHGVKMGLIHPLGDYYPIDPAGHIGPAEPALNVLKLEIVVDPTKVSQDIIDLIVFQIDESGAGIRRINHLKAEDRDGKQVYRINIHITREGRSYRANARECYLMLGAFDKRGHFTLYEAAVLIQQNHVFLVKQWTREHQAYRDGMGIKVPDLLGEHTRWPEMNDYAKGVFPQVRASLPDIKEYKPAEPEDVSWLNDNQLLITEFSSARRQLAAGRMKDGRVAKLVYWNLRQEDPTKPKFVTKGTLLDIIDINDGGLVEIPAGRNTAFKWEARKFRIATD